MAEPPPALEPERAGPPRVAMSLPSRMANILPAPGEVFDSIKAATPDAANWLIPAFVLVVVGWLGAAVIFAQPPIQHQISEMTDKAIEKQIEKRHASKEDAERMREQGAKFGGISSKIGAATAPVMAGLLIPLWYGLIVWLVGTKIFKSQFPFMKAVEVTGLANMIGVIEAALKTMLILVTGNVFASPSLALLVKDFDPQNMTHSLFAMADVMTFWFLAVVALGLARLTGRSYSRAALWVFGIWIFFAALRLGIGLGFQMAFASKQ